MSTDSTELTFVRCPSCRSLVPAMSSRCRMCGAPLDSSSEGSGDDGAEQKRSGRVRQRTMSDSDQELSSAVQQIRGEQSPPEPPPAPPVQAEAAEPPPVVEAHAEPEPEIPLDDPLSAFIEEVEVEESPGPDQARAAEAGVAVEPVQEPEPPKPSRPEPVEEPLAKSASGEPRLIVESGNRRAGGKPGGLSFSKKKVEPQPVEEPPAEEAPAVASEPVKWPPKQAQREPRPEPAAREDKPAQNRPESSRAARGPEPHEGRQGRRSRRARRGDRHGRSERPQAERPKQAPESQARAEESAAIEEGMQGRLYGWLVSYDDPDGEAIELREGKFFVTAGSLKKTDLILDDPSVSTPHAMISVSVDHGMIVQDLMSEKGVHVRRRGSDGYNQEQEQVTLEHGDWVKFGEVEFLLALIAHVGVK